MRTLFAILVLSLLVPCNAAAHYDGELLPDSVAVMEYSMIISMTPKDLLTRNKLGMVYIRQGKLKKAREQFIEILEIDPSNFDALDSLGIIADREKDYNEAAGWFEKALEVREKDVGVSKRLELVRQKLNKE